MINKQFTIKHSTEKPPNWVILIKTFPFLSNMWEKEIIVTYGDTYYCKVPVRDDLLVHEETHMRQQVISGGPEEWWKKYYADPMFRLNQEIEAYRNQYLFLHDSLMDVPRQERKYKLRIYSEQFAKFLSSDMYNNIIDYNKALLLIKQ